MSNLHLRFEAMPGSGIEAVSVELERLNRLLNITTECKFNGVTLMFCSNDSPQVMVRNFKKELKRDHPVKIVTGH